MFVDGFHACDVLLRRILNVAQMLGGVHTQPALLLTGPTPVKRSSATRPSSESFDCDLLPDSLGLKTEYRSIACQI